VTLKKLPDYRRDRGVTEKCNMDYPFECSKYLAKDGIVYLTIKNIGYESKKDHVTLYLDSDECDPADVFIETGSTKEFECYVDANLDYVSGDLEMEYYMPTKDYHDSKSGTLVVMME
jgi:hypothetical protein